MVHGQRHTAKACLDVNHIARMDAMDWQYGKLPMAPQASEMQIRPTTTQSTKERISSLACQGMAVVVSPFLATRLGRMADLSNVSAPKMLQKHRFGQRFGETKKKSSVKSLTQAARTQDWSVTDMDGETSFALLAVSMIVRSSNLELSFHVG
jgi:dephospho-CoA kinase